MIGISGPLPFFLARLILLFPALSSMGLGSYLHPSSTLESVIEEGEFGGAASSLAAVYHLNHYHSVEDIVICETSRIEAPLSGYLVDAQGSAVYDGRSYSLFRVGIRDQGDDPSLAGEEFIFIAAGFDHAGEAYFLHEYTDVEFVPELEFLTGRDEFLSLGERFPDSP